MSKQYQMTSKALDDELEELQLVLSALTQEAKASNKFGNIESSQIEPKCLLSSHRKVEGICFFSKAALYTLKRLSRFSQKAYHYDDFINANILKFGLYVSCGIN